MGQAGWIDSGGKAPRCRALKGMHVMGGRLRGVTHY